MLEDRYAVTPQLPAHLGVEVAGVVEAPGTGGTTASVGERVAVPLFATDRPFGGYAEYVAVDAESIVPLSEGLSFEAAAALLVQGPTALHPKLMHLFAQPAQLRLASPLRMLHP